MKKIILDLCGGTGSWSQFYKKPEYDVKNITLPKYDVRNYEPPKNVYGILAAPPCVMFSFARMDAKKPRDLKGGFELVMACLNIIWKCQYRIKTSTQKSSPLKFWCLENPNGFLKYFLGLPTYEFNPYDFGDNYKKITCLWGWFNEPKKSPIKCDMPKFDMMKSKDIHPEYYGKLTRLERRSITPKGFAKAFYKANK